MTVFVDGIAFGLLLFILSVGLSITLGLMNFVNLAHGAFAMVGGYITVLLANDAGIPFLLCLPLAFLGTALLGAFLERTLYVWLYQRDHLDQVLFTIGLVFISTAVVDYLVGPQQQFLALPAFLDRIVIVDALGLNIRAYRLFIIALCIALAIGLQMLLTRTRFGSQLRAAVDDARVARGLGINVSLVFTLTFAFGSGLAGLGGAIGVDLLGLTPQFPLKFLVYFLMVVVIGGTSSIMGPFLAAILLGIVEVAGQYYLPQFSSFMIYALMVFILIVRPEGLFGRRGTR